MLRRSKVSIAFSIILIFTLIPGSTVGIDNNSENAGAPSEEGVIRQETVELDHPNRLAVIDVRGWGEIKIELYENMTPITTQNFMDLADSGFYDGIKFHRCVDDFVAQTGDPNTKNMNPYDDGMGGSGITIPLEINPNATHIDGAVGMARSSEPDSASSQFYICDGPQHNLDDDVRMEEYGEHGYAVFGVVVEGLDIAKRIAGTETYGNRRPLLKDHPVDDIVMERVTIEEGDWGNFTMEEEKEAGQVKDAPALGSGYLLLITGMTALVIRSFSRKRHT
jgi:peptidyl-prolyl cis-trans isomerase B (cyclophilin B)